MKNPGVLTTNPSDQGQRMAATLAQLAQLNACADITDPVTWERQLRQERDLPGQEVLEQAVRLRQLKKMTLGDALIAGTALAYNLTLATRNTEDFTWIAGLSVFNPFEV